MEKPLTASGREAESLIRLAREKGRLLMVDHTFEYAPAINRMREIIAAGELGDLYYIRAEWLNLGLLQPDVNVIWDLATHIVSILNYVTGLEPSSLKATAAAYLRREIPEVAHIQLNYAGQVRAFMTVSWLEPRKTRSITIVGKRRMLVYDLTNTEEQIKIFDKGVDLDASHSEANQWRINYRYGDIYSPNLKNVEPLSALCGHFADCLKDRRRPRSDGESGARVVRVLEAAQRSLRRNGREIKLS
ncbi:MAG: putative oxidoreductase YvaA [candidate division TA06 bacterium ADurb.Bin417]|uniref:Putative oxidoreductase YvaA n=1 Tax=candidate division TA06 bacterium ADurb.Bin417 TaxID=1852828 RepID=A0A1V5MGX9_UNCT6|nr:MAG: putative oxidoreductase YvaA [candidate division TA06 bacterium ADurb.Bin417]